MHVISHRTNKTSSIGFFTITTSILPIPQPVRRKLFSPWDLSLALGRRHHDKMTFAVVGAKPFFRTQLLTLSPHSSRNTFGRRVNVHWSRSRRHLTLYTLQQGSATWCVHPRNHFCQQSRTRNERCQAARRCGGVKPPKKAEEQDEDENKP
jgi:hypothetical protein